MSDTPRTDAFIAKRLCDRDDSYMLRLEQHARELERELSRLTGEQWQTCSDAKEEQEGCFRAVRAERIAREAEAERDAAIQDAERYRAIVSKQLYVDPHYIGASVERGWLWGVRARGRPWRTGEVLDTAVDAARAAIEGERK